jgi:hypothetical protein
MFAWIKRRLGLVTRIDDTFQVRIAGVRREFDPIEVWRKLEKAGGIHWIDMIEPLRAPAPDNPVGGALEALHKARQHSIETLAKWVREAFGLKPFAEGGPTEIGCMNILAELFQYVNAMADFYRPFAICKTRDAPSASIPSEPQRA